MIVDVKSVWSFIKRNILHKRPLTVLLALVSGFFAYSMMTSRVVPMAFGADAPGANLGDISASLISMGITVIAFIAQYFFKVNPVLIKSIQSFEKDRTNPENQRQLGAAVLGYLIDVLKSHPDGAGSYIISMIKILVTSIDDPLIKDILNQAGTKIAAVEFATESSTPINKIGPVITPKS